MDRIEEYAALIKRVFNEYADDLRNAPYERVERIYDDAQGHYEIICIGWRDLTRIHGNILHADIIDGKIWIQHDGTERGVANDFVEAGVPKDRIVLGFQAPFKRPYTGFASE